MEGGSEMRSLCQRFTRAVFFAFCLVLFGAQLVFASVYSYEPGWSARDRFSDWRYGLNLNVTGYNKTHGIFRSLNYWAETYQPSSRSSYYWRIYFELPDDGSEWEIFGQGFMPYYVQEYWDDFDRVYNHSEADPCSFHVTINTPGSFSGVSIGQAVNAAQSARTAANNAQTAATLSADRVWDTSEGKSAALLAKEARDQANSNYSEIQNIQTSITNIQNTLSAGDTQPPRILKARGLNGATCTTDSTFDVVVDAEDNLSSSGNIEFRVKADTGAWSDWAPIENSNTAAGISGDGSHAITVEVRDEAGNTSSKNITVFRL